MSAEQEKNESGKAQKAFQKSMLQLTALLKGEALFKPLKAEAGDVQAAVEELAKEEKEALITQFKEGAKALIKEKRDFDSFVAQQKKEMEKKIEDKQKQFNEKAKGLFKMVKGIETIEKSYLDTIKATDNAVTASVAEETSEEEE